MQTVLICAEGICGTCLSKTRTPSALETIFDVHLFYFGTVSCLIYIFATVAFMENFLGIKPIYGTLFARNVIIFACKYRTTVIEKDD